ncbi:HlyD family secretion protein [Mitsuokella jalaludinii]|uniref:HlyD family secretion protein n=1 Tax=Mitsuokella jalaludinii TaxID=187979 RepID=UPI00307B61C4
MKYGLVGLILIAVLCAGGIYYYQHQHKYFNVYDAQVTSSLVAAKVHGNAVITEKVVEDGEHVEAGDVIAHVKSTVTDEQIANLEQTVALSQRNLDEVKKGQTVTVAVPSPAPAPAASAPRSSGSSQSVASAESRMNRMNELFEMGAISAVQRDAAVSAYHAAVAAASSSAPAASAPSSSPAVRYQTTTQPPDPKAVQNAELQLKQAQAALDNAKQDAAETDIVAPVAGTVYYAQGIDEGSTVKAGETVASVGNADDIWIEAKVSPDKAAKIRLGQFVSYEIEGHQLQGSVQDIQQPVKKDDQASADGADAAASAGNANAADAADANGAGAGQNGQNAQSAQAGTADAADGDAANGQPAAGNQPKTTAEVTDADDADEDVMIIRISIPSGLNFSLKPGMKAVVKFAMNG